MSVDWKQRAVEQWTADPCGPDATSARELLAGRRAYAPWMADELDYASTRDLDVLDVGCGQGIDLCEYALAGARATGIDLTPRHVDLARKHLDELGLAATVVQGDAEDLPFPNNSFDRVSSNGVLHHTPDIFKALQEIRRVLKPDGRATIIVYNKSSAHYWLHQFLIRGVALGGIVKEGGMEGVLSASVERTSIGARPLVRAYTRNEIERLLGYAGFYAVRTKRSPLRPGETFFTKALPRVPPLPIGWYLICRATQPHQVAKEPPGPRIH